MITRRLLVENAPLSPRAPLSPVGRLTAYGKLAATFPQALENPSGVYHRHPPSTTIFLFFQCTFLIVVTAQS